MTVVADVAEGVVRRNKWCWGHQTIVANMGLAEFLNLLCRDVLQRVQAAKKPAAGS